MSKIDISKKQKKAEYYFVLGPDADVMYVKYFTYEGAKSYEHDKRRSGMNVAVVPVNQVLASRGWKDGVGTHKPATRRRRNRIIDRDPGKGFVFHWDE